MSSGGLFQLSIVGTKDMPEEDDTDEWYHKGDECILRGDSVVFEGGKQGDEHAD